MGTTGDIAPAEVMLHEIGHSFAGLEDEYADPALVNTYPLNWLDSVHVTSSLSNIPWRAWMDYTDELGLVGTYEGGITAVRGCGVPRLTPNAFAGCSSAPLRKRPLCWSLPLLVITGCPFRYLWLLFCRQVPDADMLRLHGRSMASPQTGDGVFFDAYGRGAYQNGRTIALTTTDDSGYLRTGLAQTQQTENRTLRVWP